jgi:hypothetical protein
VRYGIEELQLQTIEAGQEAEHVCVKEHLLFGAARRLSIISRCLENIFNDFPPTTYKPLSRDIIHDVQINLHAYVMNLYGIFDNWAWSFIHRHNLLTKVGGRRRVGLFQPSTIKHLPQLVRDYLSSDIMTNWYEKYLKSYRDALDHRIPLYIPPVEFDEEDANRYNQLECKKREFIIERDWKKVDEMDEEQQKIGRPSFMFLHSYEEEPLKPVLFHPQLLCDGLTIIEFGKIFMEHWHKAA